MIDTTKRKAFVEYLDDLVNGKATHKDWSNFIIEHYLDERLEDIRRNIVRLRISAGDPKVFPATEKHREKLRTWANELR